MEIIKVSYERIFPLAPYVNEKIGFEATIDGSAESEKEALSKLKLIAEECHKALNPQLFQSNGQLIDNPTRLGPPIEIPVINKAEERLGILIENAASKEELMTYKDNLTTPYLADLFSSKHQQLLINK
jgi:hypothetical protein